MAQMKRNLNLEEIDSDAFLGIKFLKYQTLLQKTVFFGGAGLGIMCLLGGTLMKISYLVTFPIMFIFLGIAVMFGANYNQDFTLFEYIKMILFKPEVSLISAPTEDIDVFKLSAERLRKDEEQKIAQQRAGNPEEQRKQLMKLVGILCGFVVVVGIVFAVVYVKTNQTTDDVPVQHHTITETTVSGM